MKTGEITVKAIKDNGDNDVTLELDLDDNTVILAQELGLKLLLYCGATGTDLDYVFDTILGKES